jgi:eukaryotic-like serine/threonine-protein kinase
MTNSTEQQRHILQLYERMLAVAENDRESWLRQAANGDMEVLQQIRAMQASGQLGGLVTGGILDTLPAEQIPNEIAGYRILRCLGRGGMGSVYLAERNAQDFVHQVAIKVIKAGALTDALFNRFRSERQILAQLNHPNIARLFDAGELSDGAPFLVMEFIRGRTLKTVIESGELDLAKRITLFLQICNAVEHAHQNLIIHRDLTPTNILVSENDDAKLIDFGIARLQMEQKAVTSPPPSSKTILSPEPFTPTHFAEGDDNTLVDVFALGKLLELLVEKSNAPELLAVASKAQATNPGDRYATASSLEQAVLDWRERRPVQAFSQSAWYRFRKFVDRQRVIAAAALAITATLTGGLVMTALAYENAERERVKAEQRFAESRSLSKYLIENVVGDLEPIPGTADIRRAIGERGRRALEGLSAVPGAPQEVQVDIAVAYRRIGETLASPDFNGTTSAESAIQLLAQSEALHRQMVQQFPGNAAYKLDLVRAITAHAARQLATNNDAERAERMLDEVDHLLRSQPDAAEPVQLAKLNAAIVRATKYNVANQYALTHKHVDRSLALARKITPQTHEAKYAVAAATATLLNYRGDALWYERDDKEGALAAYRSAMSALDHAELATDIRIIKMQVFGAFNLASTLFSLGREQEALGISREGVELARRMRLFDDSIRALQMQAAIHGEYSLELIALGRLSEGDREAKVTLDIRRELRLRVPESYEIQRLVPIAQRALGEALENRAKRERACRYYSDALGEWESIHKSRHKISKFDQTHEVEWLLTRIQRC